jgi:tetratricopeptide (TPR) repeat protein
MFGWTRRAGLDVRIVALATATLSAACHPARPSAPKDAGGPASAAGTTQARPVSAGEQPRSPLDQRQLATTSGAIALANLDAEIRGLQTAIAKQPLLGREAALVSALQLRAQFLGRLADYDQAATVVDAMLARSPQDARVYALRAKTRSIYHRFAEASLDLDQAQALGASENELAGPRATILQALGRQEEALALRHRLRESKPDITTLGNEASVLADMGESEKAERLFLAAQDAYRDTSPFPIAWLWFQQGSMWAKRGKLTRAKALFQAASERVPGYAHAIGHLASLVPPAQAIELLRPVALASDDPEYSAELGVLLRDHGQSVEGEKLIAASATSYERLCKLHPEAFGDHAARFWLGAGSDGKKALLWARKNFEVRPTLEAFELVLDSAAAAHDPDSACLVAERALGSRGATSARRILAARAFDSCGKRDRADEQRALASTGR